MRRRLQLFASVLCLLGAPGCSSQAGGSVFVPDDLAVRDGPAGGGADLGGEPDLGTANSPTHNELLAIWGQRPALALAVGRAGTVLRWDGTRWSLLASGTSADLYGVYGAAATEAWIVGAAGTLLRYDGSALQAQQSGTQRDLYSVAGNGRGNVWADGQKDTLLHYDGSAWKASDLRPLSQVSDYRGAWVSPAGDLWQVGTPPPGGDIMGSAVTRVRPGQVDSTTVLPHLLMFDVYGVAQDRVFSVGDQGTIIRSAYDGTDWKSAFQSSGVRPALRSVYGTAEQDVWAVGDGGVALHYDGTAWSKVATGSAAHLRAVWSVKEKEAWGVGQQGAIVHLQAP